jgi:peptidoglycan/xylan/chitin deacetylase (PgdA/CDA1 family)
VTDQLPPDGVTVGSAEFEAFCGFFLRHFRVVPLSEQVAGCRSGDNMGGTLSITFDDGYLDNIEVAAPILRAMRLPATFFVTTGFIGSDIVPPWDEMLPRKAGWMSWNHVRELVSQGFEIGSHTDQHINMAAVDVDLIRKDLDRSVVTLTRELGFAPRLFAYPFGGLQDFNPATVDLVREAGFTCCVSCYGGVNSPVSDPYALKRIGIAEWFASPDQLGFELVSGKTETGSPWVK